MQGEEVDKKRDKQLIDFKRVIAIINSNLPQDIRLHAIKLTTQGFDVRKSARSRIYEYICPVSVYRTKGESTEEIVTRITNIIKVFEGTHNFHNYSRGQKFTDPASNRFIISMKVDLMNYKNTEFLSFKLHGQSFIYHQIRKMMGVII